MNQKPKCSERQIDPGRRMVQLALKEAMCSKLSVLSSFKREFDKKKKDKWKCKKETGQEVMKVSLMSSELPEIMKKIEEHKANTNNIEKSFSLGCFKAPKGRGRGKPLSNYPRPPGAFGEILADIRKSEMQDSFNRMSGDKVEEIMNKTGEHKASIKVIEKKMPSQNEKVPKGRGRGKPPSNQFQASAAFVTKCETFIEPPTPLHRQFFSSSESNIFSPPLNSSSMATTVFKAKTPLHSSYSDYLDLNFMQKSDTSNLLGSNDDFSNLSHTQDMRRKNENFFLSNTHYSSQTLSDQGYSSCSSLFLSDNKFLNLQENEQLFINNQQLSPISNHSSSSSLFSCDNKISFQERENSIICEQSFSHWASYRDCWNPFSLKDIIPVRKTNTIIKVCDYKKAISVSETGECGFSEKKAIDLINEKCKSCIDFPDLSAPQNETLTGLLSTLPNGFQSAVIPKSAICDNDDNELDLKSSCIKNANIFVPKYNEMESEDNHINELIDSFINKPEKKHIVEPMIDKSVGLPIDESDIQYIEELIDSFIDKPGEKKSNNLMDSFMDDPEDAYIDDLINSFISKSNVSNENTNFNISKELSSLDVPSDILSLLSLD